MSKKTKSEVSLPESDGKRPKKARGTKSSKKNNVYSNFAYRRMTKKDAAARKRAEELAELPKNPVKRFFARLRPDRVFKWWFSARGQKAIWRTIGILFLLGLIVIGGLFIYYKKELDEISLNDMSISETVNTYLDRNGEVLWEDTGDSDYRLVVSGDDIADYMKEATVAIEDKNFYSHIGVDFGALVRATIATLSGQGVQGGSTLTQQLIKQVYFSDEASSANRGGLTRKIKELILAIELERMYSKDEILVMYLNQSPYGGRRNGVESAAQTYFGKSAKELSLSEAALLAAIPNNPAILNPYNEYGNEALIERQHKVLDDMVTMGYISSEDAEAAKDEDVLATIQPEKTQYEGMKAPHFVLAVKKQLEEKYGLATMRAGGLTIKTTLDLRAQEIAEQAVAIGAENTYVNGSDDIALASVDVETSQVIAMVGSIDFYNEEYGETNATTDSLIEPGSSIKPILDYAPLFMERDGVNYGPGSILRDENINSLYCAGYTGSCSLTNATGTFYGNVSIRFSLGHSLNIAAVKALYINGIDNSLEIAHALGDTSYCEGREGYGLAIAIGSGCGVRLIEHANAYASLARGGSYKDLAYVLEIKDYSGNVLETWEDKAATPVVDEQVAYMISSILSDHNARWFNNEGFVINGVWTATKTGTTTTTNSAVTKDSLMESYSTAVSTIVWNGNHDGSGLTSNSNNVVRYVQNYYMEHVHKDVYAADGKWSSGDQPTQPAGIKTLTVNGITDIWPSWYDSKKNSGVRTETATFNKYTHELAASCTPDEYKIEVQVTRTTDPMTNQTVTTVQSPYTMDKTDSCTYTPPSVSVSESGGVIGVKVSGNSMDLASYTLYVNGEAVESGSASASFTTSYKLKSSDTTVKVVVTDAAGYEAQGNMSRTVRSGGSSSSSSSGSSSSGSTSNE